MQRNMKKLLNKRGITVAAILAVVVAGALFAARSVNAKASAIPTAEVRRGEFVDYLKIRGEIKARYSKVLTAASGSGDLQIIKLAHTGTQVKKDDVVIQFDTTNLQRTLEQKQTELKSAEAEIQRQRAEGHMTEEQNLTDSLSAKYNVELAKLETGKQEILSDIDGQKNKLTLSDTQQKLSESEQKLKSGQLGLAADVEMKKKKREKALFDVQLAQRQMEALTVRSPVDGMVTLLPNFRAVMWGTVPPDFKEGDRAWPGASVAEIPDLSQIRFEARIDESDRGRLNAKQQAVVHIDAVPDKDFTATIRDISTLAKLDLSGWPPTKNFSIDIQIDATDPRIRPGMSANSRIVVDRIPDSILLPAEAMFQKNGRSVVYVQKRSGFEERVIQVGRRYGSTVQVVSGVQPGERVALKDPMETAEKQ
jgi:HlyD family secretion protein